MIRLDFVRSRYLFIAVTALAVLLASCGGKRRYFEQIMPLIEQNDDIDRLVAKLPKINTFKDPDYLMKIDGYIATKQYLQGQMQLVEPTFFTSSIHAKLIQAMSNGIRYLQSERQKHIIGVQKMSQFPERKGSHDEFELIRELQSQQAAYQTDMKEQMMKRQYERLYYDVKDELERARKF